MLISRNQSSTHPASDKIPVFVEDVAAKTPPAASTRTILCLAVARSSMALPKQYAVQSPTTYIKQFAELAELQPFLSVSRRRKCAKKKKKKKIEGHCKAFSLLYVHTHTYIHTYPSANNHNRMIVAYLYHDLSSKYRVRRTWVVVRRGSRMKEKRTVKWVHAHQIDRSKEKNTMNEFR